MRQKIPGNGGILKLQQGWNDLRLKVVNHSGPWSFCARLRNPDGSAIEGLKSEAQ